ncbi:MAG: tRNA 2-thiouridine(34) synthase MnmA [Elusimicrobiota bacterium]
MREGHEDPIGERVVVAMSGGVDSSVAVALLKNRGYEAVGVTLDLKPPVAGRGPSNERDAKRVCALLGIPHHTLDMRDLFDSRVVTPFVESYLEGLTPNPCVECNRHVKFGRLLDMISTWDARYLATGHYARVEEAGTFRRLLKAADAGKDQSYFLYRLSQKELGKAIFPVGGMTKTEVRAEARRLKLPTAERPQSQDVCFIPRGDYRRFLAVHAGRPHAPGRIRDAGGRILGTHRGLSSYTIGQRRGIGISAKEPMFVIELDTATNTLVVGPENEALASSCRVRRVSWTRPMPERRLTASVKIRHRHRGEEAILDVSGDGREAAVRFSAPQRAVTPGQSAVFYEGDEVLGGGIISRPDPARGSVPPSPDPSRRGR